MIILSQRYISPSVGYRGAAKRHTNTRHAHHVDVLCLRSFELQLDFTELDANCHTCDESSFCGATEHRNRTRRSWANCDDETAAHMPISPPTMPSVLVKGVVGQFEGAARQHSGESKYIIALIAGIVGMFYTAMHSMFDRSRGAMLVPGSLRTAFYFGDVRHMRSFYQSTFTDGNVVDGRGQGVKRSALPAMREFRHLRRPNMEGV
jgi:hypothetical protein